MNIKQALQQASEILKTVSPTARLDSEVLLAKVLEESRTYLMTWSERELTPSQQEVFNTFLEKRSQGIPVAYITGQKEFWSLNLEVNSATLIPRPESELMVETLLALLPQNQQQTVAELGTGSGAIALAIAAERKAWQVVATDKNSAALAVAKKNALRLNIKNLVFFQADWCSGFKSHRFNAILSNPPYIAASSVYLTKGDVRFEPKYALVSGEDGLQDIRLIIQQACTCLVPGGWLGLECGYDQADKVIKLMEAENYTDIVSYCDLSGIPRMVFGKSKKT